MPAWALFGDDDEAFQTVSSGFRTDVVHACSQMVSKYRDAGLIEPWDVSRIAEFGKIDPNFLKSTPFKEDGGVWYIPTHYGFTATAWNTEKVPTEEREAANLTPVKSTLLAQTPIDPARRDRMVPEFERITAGF